MAARHRTQAGKTNGGQNMAHELSRLRREHPLWRVWESDTGHLYATRNGLFQPGQGHTVDAVTVDGLRNEIGAAENDARRDAEAQARRRAARGERAAHG